MTIFDISGKRRSTTTRRSDPESEPGSLLGEKRISCFRCGEEFRVGRLRVLRRGRGEIVRSRVYVCAACDDRPEPSED